MAKLQRRSVDTREQILDSTLRIFAKQGFARASFQNIADTIGMSQAAVLHHFGNKESLIKAVVERIAHHNYALVKEAFAVTDDAHTRLMKYFRCNLLWGYQFPDEGQILLLLYYFATVDDSFSARYSVLLQTARGRLLEILMAGEREKLFRFKLNPEQIAEMLHDSLLGLFVNFLTTVKIQKKKDIHITLRQLENKWRDLLILLTGYRG